jgi:hypothetical protein
MRKRTLQQEEDDFVVDDDGRGYADYGSITDLCNFQVKTNGMKRMRIIPTMTQNQRNVASRNRLSRR